MYSPRPRFVREVWRLFALLDVSGRNTGLPLSYSIASSDESLHYPAASFGPPHLQDMHLQDYWKDRYTY
jgi:hypothetical protein